MLPDFALRLRAYADVIVRVGLNLQRGQRLLITEPYDLQGVARSAEVIVEAVKIAAMEAGCPHSAGIEVIWGDGARLREYAVNKDWRGLVQLVDGNARRMQASIQNQDALLFLQGSQPTLLDDIPSESVGELRRIGWEHFGPIAQQLVQGATNWTVAPAPSPGWAKIVYADLPSAGRLAALWESVFEAMRIFPPTDPLAAWLAHLQALQKCRDALNAQRLKTLRYQGAGSDLTVALPPEHLWFTAQLTAKSGRPFVANLPTEEVFTLPHRDSAEGTVRVSRPVNYGGAVIDGIELEFRHGQVVQAAARTNDALLQQMLVTDEGAARLGEVALVLHTTSLARSGRLFHHPLLDENAGNHIALGEAYAFCLRSPNHAALNRSLSHLDLPLDARVVLSKLEPS
jgi:aminopeptidase